MNGPTEEQIASYGSAPWNTILYRTPYFVLPRLAIEAMPTDWQWRLVALLDEAKAAGMVTPDYHVFRADPPLGIRGARVVNRDTGFIRLTSGRDDPWANYRHGDIRTVLPDFIPSWERDDA